MSEKNWTDHAISMAPHVVAAAAGVAIYILTLRTQMDALREEVATFKTETRLTMADIKADTKGLPVLVNQVVDLQSWKRDQLALNGATDGKIGDIRVTLGSVVSDLADIKAASRQRLSR